MRAFIATVVVTVVMAAAADANATAQIADDIVIDGRTMPLHAFPFEPMEHALRTGDPRDAYLGEGVCTASYRGYKASWSIENDRLYLESLRTDPCTSKTVVPLGKLFEGAQGHVHARWFSGKLEVPLGEPLLRWNGGWGAVYERKLVFTIDEGKVVERQEVADPEGERFKASRRELERRLSR